jgi:diguanylate cyclase
MTASYNFWLVTLSIVVAVLVSYTALQLCSRVVAAGRSAARFWLLGGALAMGVGIWSMHFIGMLAFTLPIRLTYDIATTLASLAIAVASSGFALTIASRDQLTMPRLVASSLILGAGICTMHYSGMAAIPLVPMITYEPGLLYLSVVIAVGASFAALFLAFRLRAGKSWQIRSARLVAALVMGAAIAGMHYTGMAASQIGPDAYCTSGIPLDNSWMAIVVGLLALGILGITLATTMFGGHLETRNQLHLHAIEKANAQLEYQALHDALTGLPNRILLHDRLCQTIVFSQSYLTRFAVLVLDLDRFRSINDSLGHIAGDEILKEVARRLANIVRSEDTVARTSGDEFIIVVPAVKDIDSIKQLAERIAAEIGRPYCVQSLQVHTTACIGISMYPEDGNDPEQLLAHGDEALCLARKAGKDNYKFYAAEPGTLTYGRFQLENDLRLALSDQAFELHYQPKVDIRTGRIHSAEALIRWRHPVRGAIPPDQFIPIAEETGLILPIGEWVLREACRQARDWQLSGMSFMRVAVNLSALQFRQEGLFETVRRALTDAHLEPQYLELEITETCVMKDSEDSAAILERLSRMGVLVSIDDFGTGYSSMSYLRRFPIDKLKVDRSFIRDLETSPEAISIVQAIVSLAHSLRLKVIAEGVETTEQLNILRKLGCDQYQGYHCSPAMPARSFEDLIEKQRATVASDNVVEMLRTHSKLDAYRPRLTS